MNISSNSCSWLINLEVYLLVAAAGPGVAAAIEPKLTWLTYPGNIDRNVRLTIWYRVCRKGYGSCAYAPGRPVTRLVHQLLSRLSCQWSAKPLYNGSGYCPCLQSRHSRCYIRLSVEMVEACG